MDSTKRLNTVFALTIVAIVISAILSIALFPTTVQIIRGSQGLNNLDFLVLVYFIPLALGIYSLIQNKRIEEAVSAELGGRVRAVYSLSAASIALSSAGMLFFGFILLGCRWGGR